MADLFTTPAPFQPGPRLIDGSDLNRALAQPDYSVETGIVATGANAAGAFQLRAAVSVLATVAAATGVKLLNLPIGSSQIVFNDGANPVTVYDANGNTIDGTAGATGVALANAKRCQYWRTGLTTWESAQLGAVSA